VEHQQEQIIADLQTAEYLMHLRADLELPCCEAVPSYTWRSEARSRARV